MFCCARPKVAPSLLGHSLAVNWPLEQRLMATESGKHWNGPSRSGNGADEECISPWDAFALHKSARHPISATLFLQPTKSVFLFSFPSATLSLSAPRLCALSAESGIGFPGSRVLFQPFPLLCCPRENQKPMGEEGRKAKKWRMASPKGLMMEKPTMPELNAAIVL